MRNTQVFPLHDNLLSMLSIPPDVLRRLSKDRSVRAWNRSLCTLNTREMIVVPHSFFLIAVDGYFSFRFLLSRVENVWNRENYRTTVSWRRLSLINRPFSPPSCLARRMLFAVTRSEARCFFSVLVIRVSSCKSLSSFFVSAPSVPSDSVSSSVCYFALDAKSEKKENRYVNRH